MDFVLSHGRRRDGAHEAADALAAAILAGGDRLIRGVGPMGPINGRDSA